MSDTSITPYQLPASGKAGLTAWAVLSAVGVVAALVFGGHDLWRGFLLMTMLLVTLTMGSAFFIAVHYATQASWNVYVRRIAESLAGGILPWGLLVLVIVFAGHHSHLYHWMEPGIMDSDAILAKKEAYLNIPAFTGRSLIYLIGWVVIIGAILRQSRKQDEDGVAQRTVTARKWAFGFLVFFGLSYPFGMMDWIMGLEPHWFSSIYGVIMFGGSFQAALALMILISLYLRKAGVLPELKESHLHDYAKLMFAFSAFWMYTWFSQFMLIWYAHLPEETPFFILRGNEHWLWLSLLLPVLRFAVPFFGIASQANKRNPKVLIAVCSLILLGHVLDLTWLIYPSAYEEGGVPFGQIALFVVAGFGLILWQFFRNFGSRSPVPAKDPGYQYSVHHDY